VVTSSPAQYNRRLLQLDGLFAIFQGEDFGHGVGTLIAPKAIREYFLPWHKKYARMCHEAGRPYFLHSCGKMDAVMEDLIADAKIDAKHSFQERVAQVIEWKKRYGDWIGIIGGVDIDVLTTYVPDELRKYVRHIIDECSPGGRFALGSGNSIPSYIPLENYPVIVGRSAQLMRSSARSLARQALQQKGRMAKLEKRLAKLQEPKSPPPTK
jgi:uroporphyrinogen decarboxylase